MYSLISNFQHIRHHKAIFFAKLQTAFRLQQVLIAEICQRHKVYETQRGEEEATLQWNTICKIGYLQQAAAGQTHRANGTGQGHVAATATQALLKNVASAHILCLLSNCAPYGDLLVRRQKNFFFIIIVYY